MEPASGASGLGAPAGGRLCDASLRGVEPPLDRGKVALPPRGTVAVDTLHGRPSRHGRGLGRIEEVSGCKTLGDTLSYRSGAPGPQSSASL